MKSIYQQETELIDALKQSYPSEHRGKIVYDGLCWAAISNNSPNEQNNFWPENLWTQSNRRVLFLLKEPRHDGEDYRDWDWGEGKEQFGNVIWGWLYNLMNITPYYVPDKVSMPSRRDISRKYPLAIVNLKKLPGGMAVNWNTIWEYAERDKVYLKKQIREILNPTIVVCCGSNNSRNNQEKVITIARKYIFDDIDANFKEVNDWCVYSAMDNILLIDSFHPSARKSYEEKTIYMAEAFKAHIQSGVITDD